MKKYIFLLQNSLLLLSITAFNAYSELPLFDAVKKRDHTKIASELATINDPVTLKIALRHALDLPRNNDVLFNFAAAFQIVNKLMPPTTKWQNSESMQTIRAIYQQREKDASYKLLKEHNISDDEIQELEDKVEQFRRNGTCETMSMPADYLGLNRRPVNPKEQEVVDVVFNNRLAKDIERIRKILDAPQTLKIKANDSPTADRAHQLAHARNVELHIKESSPLEPFVVVQATNSPTIYIRWFDMVRMFNGNTELMLTTIAHEMIHIVENHHIKGLYIDEILTNQKSAIKEQLLLQHRRLQELQADIFPCLATPALLAKMHDFKYGICQLQHKESQENPVQYDLRKKDFEKNGDRFFSSDILNHIRCVICEGYFKEWEKLAQI